MLVRKTALLASAAATALLIASSGAQAFDEVNWVWDKYVDETVNIDIDIEADFLPSGMVEVEKLQLFFGDVTSTATAYGIHNKHGVEVTLPGGQVAIDETVVLNTTYDDDADPDGIDPVGALSDGANPLDIAIVGGEVDEGGDLITETIHVTGLIDFEGGTTTTVPAIDLPKVRNAATAVANNQDIYSTSALFLHDAQIAAGDINKLDPDGSPNGLAFLFAADLLTQVDGELDGVNLHTDLALLAVLGAATGFLEPANITATAHAFDILNASVDNSATAVGNNASFEIATTMKAVYTTTEETEFVRGDGISDFIAFFEDADGNTTQTSDENLVVDPLSVSGSGIGGFDAYLTETDTEVTVQTDAIMIADLTQVLIGDVTAIATTGPEYCGEVKCGLDWTGEIGEYSNILIDGYSGFGAAGFGNIDPTPEVGVDYVQALLVNNVATAVGNNLRIKVDGCNVCAATTAIAASGI